VNFRRLFRDYTGKTPVEYRNDIRLENAAVLLGSGEYTVSEAAESCGFSNLSFFTRLYKRRYGHTPKNE
jgi:AraC-like DNA-binding protein